jgi:hypothetical protein
LLFRRSPAIDYVLMRFGRAVLDAAPEPKEGWFTPEAGHEDLARYGNLDVVIALVDADSADRVYFPFFCQTI